MTNQSSPLVPTVSRHESTLWVVAIPGILVGVPVFVASRVSTRTETPPHTAEREAVSQLVRQIDVTPPMVLLLWHRNAANQRELAATLLSGTDNAVSAVVAARGEVLRNGRVVDHSSVFLQASSCQCPWSSPVTNQDGIRSDSL